MRTRTIPAALALAAALAAAPAARANGLNLNGLGARAVSMGGAFTAVADDFTAVYWNPAGLAFLRARTFGFSGVDLKPTTTYVLAPLVDAKTVMKNYLGGLAAYALPVGRTVTVALAVSTPSGLGAEWDGSRLKALAGGATYDWLSKIGVISVSPAVAWRATEWLSLGAAVNFDRASMSLRMPAGRSASGLDLGQYEESLSGWGFGATFGALVSAGPRVRAGLAVRTGSQVGFRGDATMTTLAVLGLPDSSAVRRDVSWPVRVSGGLAVRPVARLLLAADVQWTRWSSVRSFVSRYEDPVWSLLLSAAGKDVRTLDWRSATQVRVGAEWTLSPTLTLRAGGYADPTPAPDRTMTVLLPSATFLGLAGGVGYKLDRLTLDFGLEYLAGRARTVDAARVASDPAWAQAMPGTYGMRVWVPTLSVAYAF